MVGYVGREEQGQTDGQRQRDWGWQTEVGIERYRKRETEPHTETEDGENRVEKHFKGTFLNEEIRFYYHFYWIFLYGVLVSII